MRGMANSTGKNSVGNPSALHKSWNDQVLMIKTQTNKIQTTSKDARHEKSSALHTTALIMCNKESINKYPTVHKISDVQVQFNLLVPAFTSNDIFVMVTNLSSS